MSKKQVGIIRNNGDVHTAQIGFHIGRVGGYLYAREYWQYHSWQLDVYKRQALHNGKRIDTMMKTIKFVGALYQNGKPGKFPKLEELFAKLFPGETFPAHDALQDVKSLR